MKLAIIILVCLLSGAGYYIYKLKSTAKKIIEKVEGAMSFEVPIEVEHKTTVDVKINTKPIVDIKHDDIDTTISKL